MVEAQLMDLTVISQNLPSPGPPQIERDNILDSVELMLGGDMRLVVVEGRDGIGKTTLMSQFVRRHPKNAVSLFVSYSSRWAYDPKVLNLDLLRQIHWAIYDELPHEEEMVESLLPVLFAKLSARARLKRELYYFVLDGLDEIPREDVSTQALLLDLLPFGLNQFRFIISGEYDLVRAAISDRIASKPHQLVGFGSDEAAKYLADLVHDRDSIDDLNRLCLRIPGNLASVRRSLEAGASVESILAGDPTKPLHFFELEWRNVDEKDKSQVTSLAILANDRRKHSAETLARILDVPAASVAASLARLSFVQLDPKGEVSFVSESFRKFAAEKLSNWRRPTNALLISHLLKEPDGVEALSYLPALLEQEGQYEQILSYLSPEHLGTMLETSQSLFPIQQKASLGLEAARRLNRDPEILKFSMQKSALTELDVSDEWRAEVEARIAVNDLDTALALAQNAVLREDRLHLLSIVVRKKRERKLTIEQELIDQIKQLYSEIKETVLAKRARQIAGDLIFSVPELAIELVEKATDVSDSENSLDWALANLSVATMVASTEETRGRGREFEAHENIREKIRDPKARRFTSAAALLFGEFSGAEIIHEAEKVTSAGDRLHLLRLWTRTNRESTDAASVIQYALEVAIRATPYTFNATVLRELAIPLPFISDTETLKHLLGIFDSQQGTVEPLGPTEDFVRLQLLLARAEMRFDFEAARSRIADVYLRINEIEDLDLKTVCLSWLITSLTSMDPELRLENECPDRIHSSTHEEFEVSLKSLLESTGDHFQVTKAVVGALSRYNGEMASDVAMSLNLEDRRDAALLELFDSGTKIPIERIDLGLLDKCLDLFADLDERDEALITVIERLSGEPDKTARVIPQALNFFSRLESIRGAEERSRGCCLAYTLLMKIDPNKHQELASRLLVVMEQAWLSIDPDWRRVKAGFQTAEAISKYSLEKAREYISRTEKFRTDTTMCIGATAIAYLGCLRLVMRSYSGLLPRNNDRPEDLDHLTHLIGIVPSKGERAGFWSELAVRFSLADRFEACRRVVTDHVRPLLESISASDLEYLERTTITVSPSLYCAHPPTALATIALLPPNKRDDAYSEIADLILRKVPPGDPYESDDMVGYDASYNEIWEICELLELTQTDVNIYHYIRCVADTLTSRKYGHRFSRGQKQIIVNKLAKVVSQKLPELRNIKHDGYRVASEAQLARVQNSIMHVQSKAWDDLIVRAETIPNLADKAYVFGILASTLPPRESSKRDQLFERAKEIVSTIPAHFDKIEHYESLASLAAKSNQHISRRCIQDAMNSSIMSKDPAMYPAQRRLLDLAFRIDPSLAASLATLADDDPAKERAHLNLQRQLGLNKLKKRMIDQSAGGETQLSTQEKKDFPKAAWKNLGALNGNRIGDIHVEYTRDWIQAAAELPLDRSYPILSWVVENASRRLRSTDQARTQLRPMFEAILEATELCARMATRSSIVSKISKGVPSRSADGSSILVRSGEREHALRFLTEWFAKAVSDYLTICDAYFGPEDLQLLQLLQSEKPDCRVHIVTSRRHNEKLRPSLEEAFRAQWKQMFDQDPPDTKIIIAGNDFDGDLPIHDRWWLTKGGGIRVGTSYNSLGLKKDSEISVLSTEEAERCEEDVNQYLQLSKKEDQGRRILYTLFTL